MILENIPLSLKKKKEMKTMENMATPKLAMNEVTEDRTDENTDTSSRFCSCSITVFSILKSGPRLGNLSTRNALKSCSGTEMDLTVFSTLTMDTSFTMLVIIGTMRVSTDRIRPRMMTIVTMDAAQSGKCHFLTCIFLSPSARGPPISDRTPATRIYTMILLKYQQMAPMTTASAVYMIYFERVSLQHSFSITSKLSESCQS